MTVSIGAVLLLPFSIICNEVLLRYPRSYYIKWLNDALIHGNLILLITSSAQLVISSRIFKSVIETRIEKSSDFRQPIFNLHLTVTVTTLPTTELTV